MKKFNIFSALLIVSFVSVSAFGATSRGDSARIGFGRPGAGGTRMPAVNVGGVKTITAPVTASAMASVAQQAQVVEEPVVEAPVVESSNEEVVDKGTTGDCREAYRDCMDQFCLLDESQGERCACSDNIELAKSKIRAVLKIQEEADKLFTEGVEREQLGAKARLVFVENTNNTNVSAADFLSWLGSDDEGDDEDEEVGEDVTLGEDLYKMAAKYCAAELESCGSKAEMETMLYSRMIAQDCKNYDAYLKDQKANAESNKRIAESAVRKARLEMLDITNKYNRGECLLAFRSCVADKGGCGANFENCLDDKLLKRRSNACENILDQCMAVREDVKKDWKAESNKILADANKYAESKLGEICQAKVTSCLEDACSISTDTRCLNDVNFAAEMCPVINECNNKITGFKDSIGDDLARIRTKFCENDVDKCLQDKCGVDFSKAECIGKKVNEITSLCPQDLFVSCKSVKTEHFEIIVQSVLLQMDTQMVQGCVNYFDEQLSKVCGTDMTCLPLVSSVSSLTENEVPLNKAEYSAMEAKVIEESEAAVDEFFIQFEKDKTVAACADSQTNTKESKKLRGKVSLGTNVFNTAKMIAKNSMVNRNLREFRLKVSELKKVLSLEEARQECLTMYAPETPDKSKNNYSYIHTVSFESDLHNCHVCRIQQVCATGGETKMQSAVKWGAAGLPAGTSLGALGGSPWSTALGGLAGMAVLGGIGYATAEGKQQSCQEIESCEDININITGTPGATPRNTISTTNTNTTGRTPTVIGGRTGTGTGTITSTIISSSDTGTATFESEK